MADSVAPGSGGHALPSAFGTTELAASARPRKKWRGLLWSVSGVLIIAASCAGVHLGANLGYDDALDSFTTAAEDAAEEQERLAGQLSTLDESALRASEVADAGSGSLLDSDLKTQLDETIADAQTAQADAVSVHDEQIPEAAEKPDWAWELFGETTQLNADRDTAEGLADEFEASQAEVADAAEALDEAGFSAVTAAAEAASSFEAAHVSARNLDIIALRTAAERVQATEALDDSAAAAYVDLEDAAARMLASEKAELEEKAGPLRGARTEIEGFARSIAPGVLLDFDWSARVNGYGYGDSMGGYATWWYADPGYATIELSNSVAEQWPSDRSKALVVHEVGHAMSVKCHDMYDDSTQENIEAWATAWAISMGYHDDANGTWAYGAPPQSLIDTAAKCR